MKATDIQRIIASTNAQSASKEISDIINNKMSHDYTLMINEVYQILGKYGPDREDIKTDFRKLCEHYKTKQQ